MQKASKVSLTWMRGGEGPSPRINEMIEGGGLDLRGLEAQGKLHMSGGCIREVACGRLHVGGCIREGVEEVTLGGVPASSFNTGVFLTVSPIFLQFANFE